MKPKVYIETSVISYLSARPSRDVIVIANQQITGEWWQTRRQDFDLYVSELVQFEASGGDPEAAKKRLESIKEVPVLTLTPTIIGFGEKLVQEGSLPEKASADALHIAIASMNGLDYLLTWNFKHIANAAIRYKVERICREEGYEPPIICTPQELMEV